MILKNRDLTCLPLTERRGLIRTVLKLRSPKVHISDYFETSAADKVRAVRGQGLDCLVAKRRDSIYEAGKRTYRANRGQEFVIGGYIPGPHGLDSIVVGYYHEKDLVYVARVRYGLAVPASRRQLFQRLRFLAIPACPFINLPEPGTGRRGEGLTAGVMTNCVWLKPELVARIDFLEWTDGNHLRHSKFVGLPNDKCAWLVVRKQT